MTTGRQLGHVRKVEWLASREVVDGRISVQSYTYAKYERLEAVLDATLGDQVAEAAEYRLRTK